MKFSRPAKITGPAVRDASTAPRVVPTSIRAPVALLGWGKSAETLAAEYLEARGSSLEVFNGAGGEVVSDAGRLDPVYSSAAVAAAAIFYFCDPFTGDPYQYYDQEGCSQPFHRIKPLG